jgi:hypothetical protein
MKMTAFWDIALKYANVSEVHYASNIREMMEAVCACETSVYFSETTWCYIPEGCHLQNVLYFYFKRRDNYGLNWWLSNFYD